MLKKIGIPLLALLGVLAVAPHQAKAAVRFGVWAGSPPAYTYPAYPAYPESPSYPQGYYAAPSYAYPGPDYVYPYRTWDRHEDHERWEHRRHEWREHEEHEHGGFERGRR